MTPSRKPRTRLSPLQASASGLGLRDNSRVLPSDRVIRQHQPDTTTDARWVHFKRPSWGHCKRPLPIYELMPLKHVCLTRCRGQISDLHGVSHKSWSAAVAMGARSGGWCIGCSWALMAALFALGVMSLTWMVLIAVVVALEKMGPWPFAARLATATVLALLAAGILAAAHHVPGLVVPGSGGMHAMRAMR